MQSFTSETNQSLDYCGITSNLLSFKALNTKINYRLDSTGGKEKRTPKENVDGRSTSSHDNRKFRTGSMEKQRGMAFGFRQTATVVKKPDRQTDR